MSRLISESLTNNTTKEFVGPLGIVNAPGDAFAIAKVKLGKVAVKVAFLAMLVHTLHTTFEDGKKALHGVCVNGWVDSGDIFSSAMANGTMLRKMLI
jgi:2-methylcitrate dehydratase PrpD